MQVGFYCPTKGGIRPTPCPMGQYCGASTIIPDDCPAGTYRNTTGAIVVGDCTTCPAGFYCPSIATTQVRSARAAA